MIMVNGNPVRKDLMASSRAHQLRFRGARDVSMCSALEWMTKCTTKHLMGANGNLNGKE
jgi:hypothetical protein